MDWVVCGGYFFIFKNLRMSNIQPSLPKGVKTARLRPSPNNSLVSVGIVVGCFIAALVMREMRYNESFEAIEVEMLPPEESLVNQADTIAVAIAEAETVGEAQFAVKSPPTVKKLRPPAERKTVARPKKKIEYQITGGKLHYDKGPYRNGRYLGNPTSFISAILPYARKVHALTGLPVSTIIAQCAVESRFGVSGLALNYGNFFGYKCQEKGCRRGNHCVNMADDTPHDRFRSFNTAGEAFQAYANLIKNPRYKAACSHTGKFAGRKAASSLKKAGYATARDYATTLISVIEKYDLEQYDK